MTVPERGDNRTVPGRPAQERDAPVVVRTSRLTKGYPDTDLLAVDGTGRTVRRGEVFSPWGQRRRQDHSGSRRTAGSMAQRLPHSRP